MTRHKWTKTIQSIFSNISFFNCFGGEIFCNNFISFIFCCDLDFALSLFWSQKPLAAIRRPAVIFVHISFNRSRSRADRRHGLILTVAAVFDGVGLVATGCTALFPHC